MENNIRCLCGHGESCYYCSSSTAPEARAKDKQITELQEVLRKISATALDTMCENGVPGKVLMGLRWIRKQVANALGEADD
jgi:hypothetical protein